MKFRIKIPPKKKIEEMYYDRSMTIKDIAKDLNISRYTAARIFKHYSIKTKNNWVKKQTYTPPAKDELEKLHFNKRMGSQKLSVHYNVSIPVIKLWFKKLDIDYIRYSHTPKIPTKKELVYFHCNKKYTIQKLVKKYKVSTYKIKEWLNHYGIDIKKYRMKYKAPPNKDVLMDLNTNFKYTLKEISSIYGISDVLVGLWFKEYGIDPKINHHQNQTSDAEIEIRDYINSFGHNFYSTKSIIPPFEIDMYSDELKIGIEYCGLYWHCEKRNKDNSKHLRKLKMCENKGIKLLTIFEDEWIEKKEQVKNILRHKIGSSKERIYARKTKFVELNDKKVVYDFLDKNHIQGRCNNFKNAFGLKYKDKLVGVITYSRHHRQNGKGIVLSRLCFGGISVVGGASKLFKNSLKYLEETMIVSWSDKRWSSGDVYRSLGFNLEKTYRQDYSYVKMGKRYSKQSRQKCIIGCPKEITERDFNISEGYYRIWDCGKDKWVYENRE